MAKWTDQSAASRRASAPAVAETPPRRSVKRGGVVHRSRRHLAPWFAAAAVVSAALLGHVLGIGDAVSAISWMSLAIGGVVVFRRVPSHWRLRAAVALASGAAWLPWAVEALTWTKMALFLPGFYALKAKHDRVVRIPTPETKPDTARPMATTTMEKWDESIGAPGYALPGSWLSNPRIEHKENAVVETHDGQFVRGKQDLVSALGLMRQIASGLEEPLENLVMDEHPSRNPSRFILRKIRKGPAQAPVFYRGPRWEDGRALLGPHSDGDGWATFVVYIHKRMRNGMVIGETGSGKSRIVEIICLAPRAQQHTVILFLDGQDGLSSLTLRDQAWAFAGAADADLFLAGLEAVQAYRQRTMIENAKRRSSGFTPSREFPGLLIPIDECHKIFNQGNAERWANLAREANKVGIGLLAADQDGSLSTFKLGVLRGSLQSGNTIGLRTADREQGTILDNNGFNLRDLPKIPGFAQVLNTSGDVRQAPFRAEWLPDLDDVDQGLVPAGIETVDDWYEKVPGIPPDEGSVDAWFRVINGAGTAEPMTASGGSSGGAVVLPFPVTFAFCDDDPAGPAEQSAAVALPDVDRRRGRQLVVDAMKSGHLVHGEIMRETGLSDRQVRNLCAELVDSGFAVKLGNYGRYALVEGESAAC